MIKVAIALGSNLGDREENLNQAAARLRGVISDLALSSFHDTEPVGVGPQPRFLNAAAAGHTTLTARELLDALRAIEEALGRTRPSPGAPRTVDLDLILYNGDVINEAGLIVPHPRFRERRFVLAPLAEIAADWVDPATRKNVRELLEALER